MKYLIFSLLMLPSVCLASSDLREKADFFVSSGMDSISSKSYSILITDEERSIFEKSAGFTLSGDSVSETSIFRIASITKPLTSLAVLKLVDMGVLGLKDSLVHYIPELKRSKSLKGVEDIRLIELLTHTSGLPRRAKGNDYEVSMEKLIELAISSRSLFEPGQSYSYSNLGYALLGEVISRASGVMYEDFIRDHILLPLQMESSYFNVQAIPLRGRGDLVIGYTNDDREAYFPNLKGHAAGWGMFSTSKDLAHFIRYVLSENEEKIVSDSIFKFWKQDLFKVSEKSSRGVAWFSNHKAGETILRHGGRIDGFEVEIKIYLEKKLGFIVLSNRFKEPVTDYIDKFGKFVTSYEGDLPQKSGSNCLFFLDGDYLLNEICF